MKGKHRIILETERVKYDFTVRRNITVILGDSATGKTTLVDYLNLYALNGEGSGVRLQSDVPCVVFTGSQMYWKPVLESIKKSIVFIDEDYSFITSKDFAETVRCSDNYFVLITREPLYNLPYSTKEVFGIRTSGRFHFPEKVYHEFYPIYADTPAAYPSQARVLLLEDSGSGFDFFCQALKKTACISAAGNSQIAAKLLQIDRCSPVTVFADGAAFGAFMENLLSVCRLRGHTCLYLPESFEWLLLKSGILRNVLIPEILQAPENYIESSKYFSWEQFFTELLILNSDKDRRMAYSKSHIPEIFLTEQNKRKILDSIPDEIRQMLE